MARIGLDVQTQSVGIGIWESPTVVVSGVPANAEVGEMIQPAVNVKRADGTTPVVGAKVNFFVSDSHGVFALGVGQDTDASGDASAPDNYYVSPEEQDTTIDIIIVVWPKSV